ncbi:hypothetical protein H8E88_04940 [candidate division KSB1 bacterium]|nr:hypothetical protein [candidate division KSB1 bacterium]
MKKYSSGSYVSLVLIAAFLLSFIGCASITRNMQSTTQKNIDETPYFRNFNKKTMPSKADVKMFPATLDQKKDWFAPSLKPLLKEINQLLDTNEWVMMIDPVEIPHKGEPVFAFGDESVFFSKDETEKNKSNSSMVLIVTQPSKVWQEKWQAAIDGKADYTIMVSLGISAYRINMKNWKGSKEIQIGTGYGVDLPWLTSMDDPIPVVQLTGTLLDKNGKIIRAGAEGFFVKKTSFFKSIIGWQNLITKEDVDKIINEHQRKDLADNPLAWKVAVQNLIANLLNRGDLIVN